MRALVLGATGHIGAHVVRALLADGYEVRAGYRNPRFRFVLDGLDVEWSRVDLDDTAQLRKALGGCELVFHCAGFYPRWTQRREPAVAAGQRSIRQFCDVLMSARVARVVYTSSAATIRPQPNRLSTELDAETHPASSWRPLYATVKIAMEHEVLRSVREGLPAVIVNPSICLGEYDARPFSGRLLLLFAKRRCPFRLDHRVNIVYSGDVALGHVLAAERGAVGERYLLSAHNVTLASFADLVARESGVPPPRWPLPAAFQLAAALACESAAALTRTEPLMSRRALAHMRLGQRLDGSKAAQELGVPTTSLEDTVRRSLAWFRRHGYLD